MKYKYAAGADIGGSHICSSIVDLQTGEILPDSVCTQKVDSKNDNAGEIIAAWSRCIAESIHRSGQEVTCLGMAMPGPFDYVKGISLIEGVEKYDHLFGLDVTASLLASLADTGITEIRYTNDAAAFALGETLGGAARFTDRAVAFTLGTGFGSGFIADGKLITDGDTVPTNGWVYNLPFEESIADDMFSTRWFVKRYHEMTGTHVEGVKEIAYEAETQPQARTIFEDYGSRLADFTRPICELFGARVVILGGNIAKAYPLFGESLERRMSELGTHIEFRISELGDRAAMTGGASLFIE